MKVRVLHSRRAWLWQAVGLMACLCIVLACVMSCDLARKTTTVRSWSDLIRELVDVDRMARLDTLCSRTITSYDPTGGNEDYNHFVRQGPPGWVVLADLKGPGYVSRFWFTGADEESHRIRFFFDGERAPRLDITLGEFCGGKSPFLPPLANNENYCWYSYIPIPYAKRLIIMAQEGGHKPGGWPRLFYQINYSSLPKGETAQTFPKQISASEMSLLESVRQAWETLDIFGPAHDLQSVTNELTMAQGASHEAKRVDGPGIIRGFNVKLIDRDSVSAGDRDSMLRNVVLRLAWNDSEEAAVEVPLGDFFGSFWHRARCQSMFFGSSNDTFQCRFPMPFRSSARISFENQGNIPVTIETVVSWEPLQEWDQKWGYFHAGWARTGSELVGQPHDILRTVGKGKYVGCILSVTSADRSWWILEGDEVMFVDGNPAPFSHGTGLEDYFNGGWYYQNVLVRPLNGLLFQAFFRTVQYRIHLTDPVGFNSSFHMLFERGPDNASSGWMESIAYYYMGEPGHAFTRLESAAQRVPPPDQLASITVMSELLNYERFGDYKGAYDYIDCFLERYRDFPFSAVLRLRQIAYLERLDGVDPDSSMLQQFVSTETNEVALQQAHLMQWFRGSVSNALLGVFCNTISRVFLDEQLVGEGGKPEKLMVYPVQIGPGRHVLSVEAKYKPYPDWVQVCLLTHHGSICTTPDWKLSFQPKGNWKKADYDDAEWIRLGGLGVKGPPEPPFIWIEPNAFVDMQSKAIGLRYTAEKWPSQNVSIIYRKVFTVP